MQYLKKYKHLWLRIVVWLGRWVSQIIFSVLYSTNGTSYLGVSNGSWTDIIAPAGYFEQQIFFLSNSRPSEITSSTMMKFQDECRFGAGKCIAFRGQRMFAWYQRRSTIQYIGKDINVQNPNDLTNRFASLFDYKPSWLYPYQFLQFVGPSSVRSTDQVAAAQTWHNTVQLGEQGIRYSCDTDKIERIAQLNYEEFIEAIETKDERYRYPCTNDELAHTLAFNYYYYLKDTTKASLYYMVASFHDEVPLITLSMPAIMMGRDGNHKTSAFLRYNRLQSTYKEYDVQDHPHDQRKNLEDIMDKALKESVSEFSLYLITTAYDRAGERCERDVDCLTRGWYIARAIQEITKNCNSDQISCEILDMGVRGGWISRDGHLIYPSSDEFTYAWVEDKEVWWVKRKD